MTGHMMPLLGKPHYWHLPYFPGDIIIFLHTVKQIFILKGYVFHTPVQNGKRVRSIDLLHWTL